jgi:riboflavin kinase/FMN adenylyltransferase
VSSVRQFDALERVALPGQPVHLAIGMFDGVHLGHQSVIETAVHSARRSGGLAGVLTFWPHPGSVLRPESPTPLIMPREMKRRVLAGLGIDFLVEQHFTPDYARTTASEFVARLKHCLPPLEAVYVGENWRFGRGRSGDVNVLIAEARAAGFAVFSAPRLNRNGAPISSSRVRELLASGEIEQASELLGYPYFSESVVEEGRRLGRTLGFPTLNLCWEPELAPRYGVYAVRIAGASGCQLPGVANYGVRPTVERTQRPLLEVHVLAETRLTYGDKVTVQWLRFLRPEKRFDGLEELRAQIEIDRENALDVLKNFPVTEAPKRA